MNVGRDGELPLIGKYAKINLKRTKLYEGLIIKFSQLFRRIARNMIVLKNDKYILGKFAQINQIGSKCYFHE